MKKVMFLLAVGVMCLTACAQKKGGERGPHMGGGMSVNKDSDSTFVALKNETLKKFRQLTFEDAKTGKKHFFYIVAGGDQKASGGMRDLAKVLKENNARVDSASWSAKLPSEEQERLAEELIAKGGNINFIKWEAGSVLPESGKGMEHMASFDYGYKIAAVRDWLFRQSKK